MRRGVKTLRGSCGNVSSGRSACKGLIKRNASTATAAVESKGVVIGSSFAPQYSTKEALADISQTLAKQSKAINEVQSYVKSLPQELSHARSASETLLQGSRKDVKDMIKSFENHLEESNLDRSRQLNRIESHIDKFRIDMSSVVRGEMKSETELMQLNMQAYHARTFASRDDMEKLIGQEVRHLREHLDARWSASKATTWLLLGLFGTVSLVQMAWHWELTSVLASEFQQVKRHVAVEGKEEQMDASV